MQFNYNLTLWYHTSWPGVLIVVGTCEGAVDGQLRAELSVINGEHGGGGGDEDNDDDDEDDAVDEDVMPWIITIGNWSNSILVGAQPIMSYALLQNDHDTDDEEEEEEVDDNDDTEDDHHDDSCTLLQTN